MLLRQVQREYNRRCSVFVRPATAKSYKKELNHILLFLESIDVFDSDSLEFDHLYQYIEQEQDRNMSNVSINKPLLILKQSLKYISGVHKIDNPLQMFPLLKETTQETKIIPKQYLSQILNYIEELPKTISNLRFKMIIYILLDTGVRKTEMLHLKLSDIDFENNEIHLKMTKTHHNRTVYISSATKDAIVAYLEKYQVKKYLMEKKNSNELLHEQTIYAKLRLMKKQLGLPRDLSISLHKFRHTYATICIQNGADLEFVRSTLGHASLQQTQKYLHLSNDHKRGQHHSFGPFSNANNNER